MHFLNVASIAGENQYMDEKKNGTDMQLEDGSGAHGVTLPMQFHFLPLSVFWLQRTPTQEVDTMRKAQLPALSVSFKKHLKCLKGTKQESH